MNDPVKVIFKYKNNNRRIQYHQYLFIGEVPSNIMKILNAIKEKSLYDTLTSLSKEENEMLVKYYGEKWYKKIFNTYHVAFTTDQIRENKKYSSEIKNKYGEEWYNNNIQKYELYEKKILYNYESVIKDEIQRKERKTKKTIFEEEDIDVDYTTTKKQKITDISHQNREVATISGGAVHIPYTYQELTSNDNTKLDYDNMNFKLLDMMSAYDYSVTTPINYQAGGADDELEYDDDDAFGGITTDEDIETKMDMEIENIVVPNPDDDEDDIRNERFDDEMENDEDELGIDDLEKLYQDTDVDPDKNIKETTNLIQKALQDDRLFKKIEQKSIEFDTSKDTLAYDDHLRNVYYKHYVTTQYIYKDDSVKTVKNKICVSIRNNERFDSDGIIIPSRQYLWSEYFFNDKLEKVMIGQKWIKKTDVLNIDIEPNVNIHVYEELRGNLKLLKDNIRRYGSKIKREDDDFNILYDYENYYTNNEFYLIDIYNELGREYNPNQEALRNVSDVYIKIYFPRIKQDDIKYIIDYLGGNTKVEQTKNKSIHDTLINDLLAENEIMKDIEMTKKQVNYKKIFKENYITQSVIHINLHTENNTKIDLYRIFNEFIVNDDYPFIQFQTLDGFIVFKYSIGDIVGFGNSKENMEVLSKWFENAPYGISFKIRIKERGHEKFMAINLSDVGRVEYKTQWKEEDMATIVDIQSTYNYVKNLIKKLNVENNKVIFRNPIDEEFKYAFINTIQQFELPDKYIINHNDLSEFARYFYPYVSLVIEPRKRQSKQKQTHDKGKFGTYLRFKRVSKYENQAKIEQRVLYFIRNYDYNDQLLANEISKQFNITLERAVDEIDRVKNKYPNIKKSRKILKKLENIPKYKPPGIGIDIQGKKKDRYKIRISGARNKEQLDRIIGFYGVLIHLYIETYLYKKPERQILKEKLKKLANIAKRRNKVDDVIDYEKAQQTVKQMAKLDPNRVGFKPDKGQNQWSRSCQNSGNDKKRRPQQYTNVNELLKQGFKLNKETNTYEKKIIMKKGSKKKEIMIRAVGLDSLDDNGNVSNTIYYSCNPDDNGIHSYIGFLSRSNNPYGQCMPCCFKKDALASQNKNKRDYFLKCIGKMENFDKVVSKATGDKIYILQDTNKIQEGRIGFLPKYLDYFFNQSLGKVRKIKGHHLLSSETGYYLKHGSKQDDDPFLNAIASALETTVKDIKDKIVNQLNSDKNDQLFTSLNNGDIKTAFKSRDKYIDFIQNNKQVTFDMIQHIISTPGVIHKIGLNIIVFKKEQLIIKKTLDKEKIIDDFTILCQNPEEIGNIKDIGRENIIIIKENNNYYPIILVIKKDSDKVFTIIKTFKYEEVKSNILYHMYDYYIRACGVSIISENVDKWHAKNLYNALIKLNNSQFAPQYQYIDARNKCKYIITKNNLVLPILPSGSIYNLQIINTIDNKIASFDETLIKLNELTKISSDSVKQKPIGIYYDYRTKDTVNVIGIMTVNHELLPTKPQQILLTKINDLKFIIEYKQLFDKVDKEIDKGSKNIKIDKRIENVNLLKYENEAYQLFRLHLSNYLSLPENELLKKKLMKIVDDGKLDNTNKKHQIRLLLYRIIDRNLYVLYENVISNTKNNQEGGKYNKFINIVNKLPNISNYHISNNREICQDFTTKENCSTNMHCSWTNDTCRFMLTKELIIIFINKVSEELIMNDHKTAEIFQSDGYFVSDIVDYNYYEEREGQRIINTTNNTINKTLTELFGKDNIPKIGKRRLIKATSDNATELNIQHSLQNMGDYKIQQVMNENISILRAYANGFFWLKNNYNADKFRNLGYYDQIQTDLANYFRSNIIDWILDKNNYNIIVTELKNYIDVKKNGFIKEFINKITRDITTKTNGIVEYFILNRIYDIPVILYDRYNTITHIIDKTIQVEDNGKYKNKLKDCINVRYSSMNGDVPADIQVLYFN